MRLTKSHKTDLIRRVLRHRFNDDHKAICERRAAAASALYEEAFTAAERRKMARLPDGWLPETAAIRLEHRGKVLELPFSGRIRDKMGSVYSSLTFDLPEIRYHRAPSARIGWGKALTADIHTGCAAVRGAFAIHDETVDFCQEISRAERTTARALDSVGSIARLRDVWPEIAPLIPSEWETKPSLPAVPVESLNAALRLPPKEETAAC